jgi:hypothetical protein
MEPLMAARRDQERSPADQDTAVAARTSPAFLAAVGLTLVAAAVNGLMVGLMALRLDALLPGPFAQMGHFTDPRHRVHDVTFAVLFVPTVLGLLAQLRRPTRSVAGMAVTLVPPAALLTVLALTVALGGNLRVLQPPWVLVMTGALAATALHPAGSDFFRSFRLPRLSWTMLALVAVAAVALLPFAFRTIGLQGTVSDDHAAAGHYGFMAGFALATLGLGLLASLRPDGWRLAAWGAGLLPLLVGATSLAHPAASSSLGRPWALAAMAWAVVFIAVAQRSTGPQNRSRG